MVLLPGCKCCGSGGGSSGCPADLDTPIITFDVPGECAEEQGQLVVTEAGGAKSKNPGPITKVEVKTPGSGYARIGRVEPLLTASAASGSGATFTIHMNRLEMYCGLDLWQIDSISVSGGTGYADGDEVIIAPSVGDTTMSAATATLSTSRVEPTVTATAPGGSGAELSVTLMKIDGAPGDVWGVASVEVIDGGTGYTNIGAVTFSVADGDTTIFEASASIFTDENGTITSVAVDLSGWYYRNSGVPASVTLTGGTEFENAYYREDPTAPPYVGTAFVRIPDPDLFGSVRKAVITPIIGTDPSDPSFGTITGATIVDGGDGYQAYGTIGNDCFDGCKETPCCASYTFPSISSITVSVGDKSVEASCSDWQPCDLPGIPTVTVGDVEVSGTDGWVNIGCANNGKTLIVVAFRVIMSFHHIGGGYLGRGYLGGYIYVESFAPGTYSIPARLQTGATIFGTTTFTVTIVGNPLP